MTTEQIDSESLAVLGNQRGQRCGVDDLAVHYNDGRVPSLGKISLIHGVRKLGGADR